MLLIEFTFLFDRLPVLAKHQDRRWDTVIVFLCGLLKGDQEALDMLYRQVICKDLSGTLQSVSTMSCSDLSHGQYHLGLKCLSESGIFDSLEELAETIVPHCFVYSMPNCHYCLQGLVVALSERPLHHKPELVIYGVDIAMYDSFDYKLLEVMSSCNFPPALVFSNVVSVYTLLDYCKKFCAMRSDMEHMYIYMQDYILPQQDESCDEVVERESMAQALDNLKSLRTLVFEGKI